MEIKALVVHHKNNGIFRRAFEQIANYRALHCPEPEQFGALQGVQGEKIFKHSSISGYTTSQEKSKGPIC